MIEEINFKLEQLGEYVGFLRKYQPHDLEELKNDYMLRAALERNMEVSLSCMIDICERIISSERLKRPDTYREVILTLGQHEILPKTLAEKLAPAAGFRNLLIHMYVEVDLEKFYTHLQEEPDNLELFAKYIAQYLIDKYE